MRRLLIVLCLLAGLLSGLVMLAPLQTILRLAGVEARGLSWTNATGTLAGGSITGLRAGDELLGEARLKLDPSALLRLGVRYEVQWAGPSGSGHGRAAAYAGGMLELTDFRIALDFRSLDGLALWIRQSGGQAEITGGRVQFRNGNCHQASGRTWSNALTVNADLLGPGWPDLTGDLACDGPQLVLPFIAQSASGTHIDATARFGLYSQGTLQARVSGFIPQDFQYALPIAGFVPEDGAYFYRYPGTITERKQ